MGGEEAGRLAEQLRRALEGEAWHGPSVHECLADVSAAQAAAHPIAGAHSIWELVLHLCRVLGFIAVASLALPLGVRSSRLLGPSFQLAMLMTLMGYAWLRRGGLARTGGKGRGVRAT